MGWINETNTARIHSSHPSLSEELGGSGENTISFRTRKNKRESNGWQHTTALLPAKSKGFVLVSVKGFRYFQKREYKRELWASFGNFPHRKSTHSERNCIHRLVMIIIWSYDFGVQEPLELIRSQFSQFLVEAFLYAFNSTLVIAPSRWHTRHGTTMNAGDRLHNSNPCTPTHFFDLCLQYCFYSPTQKLSTWSVSCSFDLPVDCLRSDCRLFLDFSIALGLFNMSTPEIAPENSI